MPLKPLSCTRFRTGVLYLVYGPATEAPEGGYEEARTHLPAE